MLHNICGWCKTLLHTSHSLLFVFVHERYAYPGKVYTLRGITIIVIFHIQQYVSVKTWYVHLSCNVMYIHTQRNNT